MFPATLISQIMQPRIALVLAIVIMAVFCGASAPHAFSQSDFSVTKTASSATVGPGANITYTITITNAGPGTATSSQVLLSDAIPEDTTFVSFTQVGTAYNCVTPDPGGTTSVNCFNQTPIGPG